MNRLVGLALAVVLVVRSASRRRPSRCRSDLGRERRVRARVHADGPFERPRAGSLVDAARRRRRWARCCRTSRPPGRQPRRCRPTLVGRAARPARLDRSRGPAVGGSIVASTRPSTALPTGSLYWPGGGMPLYSPAQRYAAYGQGYGVSPYGRADYGAHTRGCTGAIEPIGAIAPGRTGLRIAFRRLGPVLLRFGRV